MALVLVLGGARSGKSAYVQRAAEAAAGARTGARLVMIATAEASDAEMAERIARHQQSRGGHWSTVEAPLELAPAVRNLAADDCAVIDCLTLWLNNLLMAGRDTAAAAGDLVTALERSPARIWAVSNEVGMGIVPENALARLYRDEIGQLHQALAQAAERVVLMVAGMAVGVK